MFGLTLNDGLRLGTSSTGTDCAEAALTATTVSAINKGS